MFEIKFLNEFDLIPRLDEIVLNPNTLKNLEIWPFERVLFCDEKNENNFVSFIKPQINFEENKIGVNNMYYQYLNKQEITKANIKKLEIDELKLAKKILLICKNNENNDTENHSKWNEWVSRKVGGNYFKVGLNIIIRILNEERIYKITSINENDKEDGWFESNEETKFELQLNDVKEINEDFEDNQDLMIYKTQYQELNFLIQNSLEFHDKNNILSKLVDENIINYILINGPFGCGKKYLLKKVMKNFREVKLIEYRYTHFQSLRSEEINIELSKYVKIKSPLVIAIYSIDYDVMTEGEEEEIKTLKTLFFSLNQFLNEKKNVCFVFTSRNKNKIETNVIRKLKQIELESPSIEERVKIIKTITKKYQKIEINEEIIEHISQKTSGFVAFDFIRLFKNSFYNSLKFCRSNINHDDIFYSLNFTVPSQLRDFQCFTLPLLFDRDLVAYHYVRNVFQEVVQWPLVYKQSYQNLVKHTFGGILLYGPSGCGKTSLVHALANEMEMKFISVKGTQIFSSYFGESEAAIRRLFERARKIAPCLLFIDEIDVLGSTRDDDSSSSSSIHKRVLSQMLNEMDGVQSKKQIVVVGCSNQPHKLDSAILRPGRLDKLVYVAPPTFDERIEILKMYSKKICFSDDVSFEKISQKMENYSCSSIVSLMRESVSLALKENENFKEITQRHIDVAHFNLSIDSKFSSYKPFTNEDLEIYQSFLRKK